MSDPTFSPLRQEESATTREEMDFDDNDQEPGTVSPIGHETPTKQPSATPRKSVSFQEPTESVAPVQPPQQTNEHQQAEITLVEAFPSIDPKVIRAVLRASGGNVEPAFNALLGMSDPDYKPEEAVPPPKPPRPTQRAPQNQMEADELYARQLAEQYNSGYRNPGQNIYNQREPARRGPNQQKPWFNSDSESSDRNFFDDELPEIGRNIQQGFIETQKKVNGWISTFKKKMDGEQSDDEDLYSSGAAKGRQGSSRPPGRQNFGPSQSEQLYGIQKQAEAQQRRSTEASRYDADPQEFDDGEFERLELRDDEAPPPQPPRTSSRKTTNPNLFASQPTPPQKGPVDEVDAAERNSSDDKSRKWQPLTSIAPHPEDDNDPFSLGDDDDDREKNDEVRKEDSDRLKEAARTSISAGKSGDGGKVLQESERSGSVNKDAEALLSGKST